MGRLKRAYWAQQIVWTDDEQYTDDVERLGTIEPVPMLRSESPPGDAASVAVHLADPQTVYLMSRGRDGCSYYVRVRFDSTTGTDVGFATDPRGRTYLRQTYSSSW